MIDESVNTFVEVGPGRVLTGLLRQIERSVAALNIEDEKSLAVTLDKIAGCEGGCGVSGRTSVFSQR